MLTENVGEAAEGRGRRGEGLLQFPRLQAQVGTRLVLANLTLLT